MNKLEFLSHGVCIKLKKGNLYIGRKGIRFFKHYPEEFVGIDPKLCVGKSLDGCNVRYIDFSGVIEPEELKNASLANVDLGNCDLRPVISCSEPDYELLDGEFLKGWLEKVDLDKCDLRPIISCTGPVKRK